MGKRTKKTIAVIMTLLMSVMVLTACGGGDAKDTGKDSDKTASQVLTKDSYKEKVTELSLKVTEISGKYAADMQSQDQKVAAEATKKMIDEIKPIYEELGDLNAPEEFSAQQTKIKEGCDASVKVLDMSLELINLGLGETEGSAEDIAKKVTELQEQLTELTGKAQSLTTALQEVMTA